MQISAHAQVDHCGIQATAYSQALQEVDFNCIASETQGGYGNLFTTMLKLEQHVPGKATSPSRAIKTIKLKVFIWGNGTAFGQYVDNEANRLAISQTIERIEENHLVNIHPPTDPTPYYHGLTGQCADQAFIGYERGIFFTESYAFSIRDNEVYGINGSKAEGIVIGYTRDWNEVVQNNAVHDLQNAYVGEGICADVNNGGHNFIGLQFTCNTNANNALDFWSRKVIYHVEDEEQQYHTIRGHQGSATSAADNTFDPSWGLGHWDFLVGTDFTIINYFKRPTVVTDGYTPQNFDINRFQVFDLTGANASPCNSSPPGPVAPVTGVITDFNNHLLAYANTRYLYNGLIDGGNTDEVVQEVMSAWPNEAWELRTYLMGQSPYLSVEALKAAMNKTYFPMAMKAEVCIANPDATKQQEFIKWLEYEATEPMPAYLIDAIKASWETKTYRTDLEVTMASQHTAMTEAAETMLANHYLEPVVDLGAVRWVWQQIRNPAARYGEANVLLAQNNYDAALAVVQGIQLDQELKTPQLAEQQRMIHYIQLLKNAHTAGRDKWHLTAAEVDQLEAQIGTEYDRSATWMSNLLCVGYGICRPPLTGGEEETPKSIRIASSPIPNRTEPQFRTAPNPASTWVSFSYERLREGSNAYVVVRDAMGKQLCSMPMPNAQGQLVMDTRMWGAGIYTAQYMVGGICMQTDKLVIQ